MRRGGPSAPGLLGWSFACGIGLFVLSVGALALPLGGGILGVLLAAPVLALVLPGTPAPAASGVANRLTLLRLAIVAALGGQVLWALIEADGRLAASGWAMCVAYTAAATTDALDGPLARRFGGATGFGARLDAETDALGIAAAATAAVLILRTLPSWYLVAGFARYLFGLGLEVGRRLGRAQAPLPPSPFRRRLAGFQMGLLAVCLGPWVRPEWAEPSAFVLGIPFLVGFALDFLFVVGALDPQRPRWRRGFRRLAGFRRPGALGCFAASVALGGFGAGAWALGAFFLGWLLWPGRGGPIRR